VERGWGEGGGLEVGVKEGRAGGGVGRSRGGRGFSKQRGQVDWGEWRGGKWEKVKRRCEQGGVCR